MENLEYRCLPSSIIDIGTLGGYNSAGWGVNNSGIVVGDSNSNMFSGDHAFSYRSDTGRLTDLGTLPGGTSSQAFGINDSGQIVGASSTASGNNRAFLFNNGTITDLGTLGGSSGLASAINASGAVAGFATTTGGQNHAFLYNGSIMTDLGTIGGPVSWANAVNDSGQVVGASLTSLFQQHAFLYSGGAMTDLGTMGGFVSEAFGINNQGWVVGEAMTSTYQVHAFLYKNGSGMTDLGTFGGWGSYAYSINNQGQVAGTAQTATGGYHAFLYKDGVMTDLNNLLPANSGWLSLTRANSINSNGQIAGTGITATGFTHAFLYSPDTPPPPPTLADGTILVTSSPLSGQPSAPTGIIAVNPNTGAQTLVSSGGLFSLPVYVREASNGQLYVADYSASQKGAVIRLDPNSGQQSLVASGGNINGPDALTIINGFLYVADVAGVPNLVEINLSTGQQRLVSSGGSFSTPVALVPGPNNTIYWADEYAFGGTGAIFSVNIQTGAQSIITQGGLLNHMIDMGIDASGSLLAFNAGGSVIRINPQTQAQTTAFSGGLLARLDGGTVDVNHGGSIFVGALASGSVPSRILAVDPSGTQRTVSSGGNLSLVAGLVAFTRPTGGGARDPGSDPPMATVQAQIDGSISGSPMMASGAATVTRAPTFDPADAGVTIVAVFSQPVPDPMIDTTGSSQTAAGQEQAELADQYFASMAGEGRSSDEFVISTGLGHRFVLNL